MKAGFAAFEGIRIRIGGCGFILSVPEMTSLMHLENASALTGFPKR